MFMQYAQKFQYTEQIYKKYNASQVKWIVYFLVAKDTRTQYKKCPTLKKCLKYPYMELEADKKQYLLFENGGQNFTQLFLAILFS